MHDYNYHVQLPIFYVLKPQNSPDNHALTSHQNPTHLNVGKKTKELKKKERKENKGAVKIQQELT